MSVTIMKFFWKEPCKMEVKIIKIFTRVSFFITRCADLFVCCIQLFTPDLH